MHTFQKTLLALVLGGLVAPQLMAEGLSTAKKIENAMSAAPAAVAADATILDWPSAEGETFAELRKGSNGWTCFPAMPSTPGNDPMCVDQTWMSWIDAYVNRTAPDNRAVGLSYMLQGGIDASNSDPFAEAPAAGQDWMTRPPHIMVLSPVKLDTTLFSSDPDNGGPWIMWGGTPYEHLMVPVTGTTP